MRAYQRARADIGTDPNRLFQRCVLNSLTVTWLICADWQERQNKIYLYGEYIFIT